ncbi:PREDICTED: putative helicase mov-10-B.1, partial [Dinoponera quadriceps]|uniref:Helicase mov-10-B.1 n=1 Tax=Dinoponera quadriceps TaxID=609295 RepID=A0A6P3X4N6_DINQU
LEQYQADLEMKRFRMENYNITKITPDQCFIMKVPSLDSEKPIIIPDDIVTLYDVLTKEKYIGRVTNVIDNNVTVQLKNPAAMKMKNNKFNIGFYGNYWPLRCCHYALSIASKLNFLDTLYPQQTMKSISLKYDLDWMNSTISKNEQQKQAVTNILQTTSCPAPYILFGPPGTGKTATLVEAICQIVRQDPSKNILVCTSSNAAADEITRRLIQYLPAQIIYRMYAPSRHWEDVKKEIRECANFVGSTPNNTISIFLPKEILILKKIIISTLITSVRLAAVNFRENHFSHIIIDEASQATEPETLVPLILTKNAGKNDITNFHAQIVIAGDHFQLGPVIRNRLAENILGKSMLERLMNDCDVYKKKDGKYNPHYVTKLVKNYRSHRHIIHVPNDHFYENELECYEHADTQIALNWNRLPNKKFPIIFQEVLGVEERSESRSVYNTAEVFVVVEYVKILMNTNFGKRKITQSDIGIVTPFKKQQLEIKRRLVVKGWENIMVGTVEIFQGQERTVMIMSTVRSKIFTHNDVQHIGFLSNPKRFNVAITRAKALLIITGNPKIICTDKHWQALWEYCKENNGCRLFDQCPLEPALKADLKKYYETNLNKTSETNAAVSNEVSIHIETDLMKNVKGLETLTNVLVCGIEKVTLKE